MSNIFSICVHFTSDLAISFVLIRRNSVNTASGVKTAATVVFSDHDHSVNSCSHSVNGDIAIQ